MGHFRQWSRFGGYLPENSIPNGLGRKQSKSVENLKSFPDGENVTVLFEISGIIQSNKGKPYQQHIKYNEILERRISL